MKHAYLCVVLVLATLFSMPTARAQRAWRPFQPGLIYAFSGPGSGSARTLRLDSAYVTAAGDSVWMFKRLLKTSNGREQSINPCGIYRKSRNNLFGARLIWQRAPAAFVLENLAEGSAQAAVALQLRPQAAVGSTWAASRSPVLMATPRPCHTLRLTDVGCTVWQAAVSVGHTALAVPLAGQPAGCYLMHLSGADGTTAT